MSSQTTISDAKDVMLNPETEPCLRGIKRSDDNVIVDFPSRGILPASATRCASLDLSEPERRRETRIAIAESATIVSLHPWVPLACTAMVCDISKSGIGLLVREYVPHDVFVKIVLDTAIVFGVVRHCSRRPTNPESFKIGVEIQTVVFRKENPMNWLLGPKALWKAVGAACKK